MSVAPEPEAFGEQMVASWPLRALTKEEAASGSYMDACGGCGEDKPRVRLVRIGFYCGEICADCVKRLRDSLGSK